MPSISKSSAEIQWLPCAMSACWFAVPDTLQLLCPLMSILSLGLFQLLGAPDSRKLQEILRKLFLESITTPVVLLPLPNHTPAVGLCIDTLLLCWRLNLAILAHTSWAALQGKMLLSWQPKLTGQFYSADAFLLP